MLKIVGLVKKRDDLTWDEFVEYWEEKHIELVTKQSNLKRYTIAPAIKPEEASYDGIAELYYESTDDIRNATTEELDEEIRADEEMFLESVTKFVAAERVQVDRT